MTEADVPRFRQGAGRLCLDFIRTLRRRGTPSPAEQLPDPVALAAWAAQFGPYGPGSPDPPSHALLREAHQLREAIFELLTAARSGAGAGSVRPAARELVNRGAAHSTPVPRLDESGRLTWHADEPVAAVLALVARDALDLALSDSIARVRNCANPACQVMFLDASRPGTRRWCSMNACGNLAKKDALRDRTRTRPSR
ncbi:MAG TPA: ABATE domain-containing protein [Streptosporangiaceae bacterium]|nr:ABATE domain-containing protein [Streptosporangiaceae bacterium]